MFDMFNADNAANMPNYTSESSSSSSLNSVANSSSPSQNSFSSGGRGFVISVGGSLFIDEKPIAEKIQSICNAINDLANEVKIVIVVGGGKTCRNYQAVAQELGANNFELDRIGIASTRLNAMLFLNKIEKAHREVMNDFARAKELIWEGRIPILGGMVEGQTSDAVAALCAEMLGFDFINLSNVEGIFDADPNVDSSAVLFKELSYSDMNFLLRETMLSPGAHTFVDMQAAAILTRSRIKSFFLSGEHLENFKNCVRGYDYKGTLVHDVPDFIEKDISVLEASEKKFSDDDLVKPKRKKRVLKKKKAKLFMADDDEEDKPIDPRQIDF